MDCGNHALCISLAFIEFRFFMYVLITKRSNSEVTLLESTIRLQWSEQMKSTKLLDLISLRTQLILATYLPKDFIKVDILL